MTMMILMMIVGLALLYYGADWLVHGGCGLAARYRVSPLIVGLTLVAFGTSAPELFVSVGASLAGQGDVCVGNIVGSNICNIALILGVTALIAPLSVDAALLRRDVWVMIVAAVAATGCCCWNQGMGRLAGGVFLLAIVLYTLVGLLSSGTSGGGGEVAMDGHRAWGMVVGGLLALVVGAKLILAAAVAIERTLGVPDELIALTVVAVGTSLPEFATSVIAARKGEHGIAIGNIVGSNIFNVFGILGASALARPFTIEGMDVMDFATMIGVSILLGAMMMYHRRIGRIDGMIFLLIYAVYLWWLFGRS